MSQSGTRVDNCIPFLMHIHVKDLEKSRGGIYNINVKDDNSWEISSWRESCLS